MERLAEWFRSDPRRIVSVAFSALFLVPLGLNVVTVAANWDHLNIGPGMYQAAAANWLHGGSFYLARQLDGPYVVQMGDVLYPPTALIVFVPFLALPAILWWAIPLGVTTWAVYRLRPSSLVWPFLAICLAFPSTLAKVVAGNPSMWVMMAVALGALYGWPAVLVLLKPTLAPFALLGIRRPTWWVAAAVLAMLSLVFLPLWPDYLRSTLDARNQLGPLYSLQDAPLVAIPLVAWLGSARRRGVPQAYSQIWITPAAPTPPAHSVADAAAAPLPPAP
jgi:hypothetical protein